MMFPLDLKSCHIRIIKSFKNDILTIIKFHLKDTEGNYVVSNHRPDTS